MKRYLPIELAQATPDPEIAAHPSATQDAGNQAGGDGAPSASPAASPSDLRPIEMPMKNGRPDITAYVKTIAEEMKLCSRPEQVDTIERREKPNYERIGTATRGLDMEARKRKAALAEEQVA